MASISFETPDAFYVQSCFELSSSLMENWCEYVSQEGEVKNVLQVSGCVPVKEQLASRCFLTPQKRSSRKNIDFEVQLVHTYSSTAVVLV